MGSEIISGSRLGGLVLACACAAAVLNVASTAATEPAATGTEPTSGQQQPAPAADLRPLFRMHFDNRLRSFREQNAVYRNVVLLGDSITEGFDVELYFPGRRVLNRGIGGDVIGNGLPQDDHRGLRRRLDESVFDCAATDVFLMIGINDLGDGRTPETMAEGYREILKEIKAQAPRARVHVQSVLPTRDKYAKHNEAVRDFNERIKKLAGEFGYDYLDVHRLMVDDKGELKAEYASDGLHLNEIAYRQWQAEIERAMGWQ